MEDEHEAPPAVDPTPEPHHEPTTEPHNVSHEECRTRIDGLSAKVTELEATVENIVQNGNPDSTPVHRPWTHYGAK